MKKRGQAVIMDLFVAISVFIILIMILMITWDLHSIRLTSRLEYDDMILKTFTVADILVKSEGVPFDWEDAATSVFPTPLPAQIGLSTTDSVLSAKKVMAFRYNLSSENVSNLLNIGAYNYYFLLRDLNGTKFVDKGTVPAQARTAVNIARIVVYAGAPRVMEFALWKR